MKMRRFVIPASIFLSIIFFSRCGDEQQAADDRQVFRFNELGEVKSLDPAMAGSFENNWALNQLYNGLVEMDTDLFVRPCIARSWDISDDGMEYTFHLRPDIYFHDSPQFPGGKGRRVTAADFEYSFARLFDKKISNASTLIDVVDRDVDAGKAGCTAVNDSTFTIRLRMPFRPFLGILTMKYFSVVPKEVVVFYGSEYGTHPVGTGPFRLKYWKSRTSLVFEKNPAYFKFDSQGNRLPYLELVSVSFIKDAESAYMQVLSGDLDMITGIDAINKEKTLEKDGSLRSGLRDKFVLQSAPFLKTDYLGILIDPAIPLSKNSPLISQLVRQAVNYSIDREKIVRYRRNNLGTPATGGFIPPDMHAYDPSKLRGFAYDPDKARQLLAKAGFPGGKGLKPLKLATTGMYQDIAEDVAHQLNEVGIPVEVEILMPATFTASAADSKLLFFRKSWICDYPDPENFMSIFYSKHFSPEGPNYTHLSNKEFDRLYEQSLVEQDDSIRAGLFLQMDQIIVDASPVVPLYYDRVVRLVSRKVEGLAMDPTNTINLERVRKR
jgi:oligopeptide transport system substrate-binding protein